MKHLAVLADDPHRREIISLARFLGLDARQIRSTPEGAACAIMSGTVYERHADVLTQSNCPVFVYDAGSSKTLAVSNPVRTQFVDNVEVHQDQISGVLGGLDFKSGRVHHVFSGPIDADPEKSVVISAGGWPAVLRRQDVWLSAAPNVLDIDQPCLKGEVPHRDHFFALVPFVLFIKRFLGPYTWRAQRRVACITIDDPLLWKRYGCIAFDDFAAWITAHNLAATFGFIPWNYRRTSKSVADIFTQHRRRLSLAVHGCDHTRHEFAEEDEDSLRDLSVLALARMNKHAARYNVGYDHVMIFPQGKFALEALSAVSATGYTAAVSSGSHAVNETNDLTIRHVLDLAIVRDGSFPHYQRRYPGSVFDFGCDVLFEKPLIIAQHHDDFGDGYDQLLAFTGELKGLAPDLVWLPLEEALAEGYWRRTGVDGETIARRLINPARASQGVVAECAADIERERRWVARLRIAGRRYLSEFRDNVARLLVGC